MASFQEMKAVFMGLYPAMPEAAKDSRATGGVILASWLYQKTIMWAESDFDDLNLFPFVNYFENVTAGFTRVFGYLHNSKRYC